MWQHRQVGGAWRLSNIYIKMGEKGRLSGGICAATGKGVDAQTHRGGTHCCHQPRRARCRGCTCCVRCCSCCHTWPQSPAPSSRRWRGSCASWPLQPSPPGEEKQAGTICERQHTASSIDVKYTLHHLGGAAHASGKCRQAPYVSGNTPSSIDVGVHLSPPGGRRTCKRQVGHALNVHDSSGMT
jgi:hypothetical protein